MSSINTRTLDHIVHLTPPGSVDEVSNQFRDLGFHVVPGGTHAGGLTANALVVFEDGFYLELISFLHPVSHYPPGSPERKAREESRWAACSPGWIDFAFLGNGSLIESVSHAINDRAREEGSGVEYAPEIAGGRKRPDGKVLKWLISAPPGGVQAILPFFCGDVTPRDLRVPSEPPSNTQHPSTATGIAHIRILTDAASFQKLSGQLTSVVGRPPRTSDGSQATWVLDTVNEAQKSPELILSIAGAKEEEEFLGEAGTGIYEVGFRVNKIGTGRTSTPYGKISWVR